MEENLKSQWRKWMGYIYDYLPTKYEASKRDWAIRRYVWNFKEGKGSETAAKMVADRIRKQFGEESQEITLACIPASTEEKTVKRYQSFAAEVCRLLGCKNAFEHIRVEGERLAIHERNEGKKLQSVQVISFDNSFFAGKKVVVFDDILTRGYSYARFACQLERMGANVLGGIFLARTLNVG